MNSAKLLLNKNLKSLYLFCLKYQIIISEIFFKNNYKKFKLHYAGARTGSIGGPLVKISKLQEYFPQKIWGSNIYYLISNAPYLDLHTLKTIKLNLKKIVLNQNGVYYPAWFAGDYKYHNSIAANAYRISDYVFWQSNFCQRASNKFLGNRDGPGEILYNAVDTNRFIPIYNSSEVYKFLITGKITKKQSYRIYTAISALKIALNKGLNAELIIAGWVEDWVGVYSYADLCGLSERIRFLGNYSQKQAPDVYIKANAYLMLNYMDNCPTTVIEAMSCGLPTLYLNSGGVPELVGPSAGIGLEVKEDWSMKCLPSALEIANGMLNLTEKTDTMGRNARDRAVQKFDIEYWIKRHKFIFSALIKEKL